MPDAEHQLDVVRTILRGNGNTFTGLKAEMAAQ
jgi:hypothetical protein